MFLILFADSFSVLVAADGRQGEEIEFGVIF